jgi:glutamine---fructose-6-phosphate transaminase (isomerizing)
VISGTKGIIVRRKLNRMEKMEGKIVCGIVGYAGGKDASSILLEGLKRLEYRGYDSAGIAIDNGKFIQVIKEVGKLKELEEIIRNNPPEGVMGIGHTRWATHGVPSDVNAHPHADCSGDFVVVHNGIIENFQEIKEDLIDKGHKFISETDTEVIAHLIEEFYAGDLKKAVIKTVKKLNGSYALAILSRKEPGKIIAVRKDSPLIVGKGQGENFLASDIPAFLHYTDEFYILDDGEMAEITGDNISVFNTSGKKISKTSITVDWDSEMVEKNGYEHFMLKEIHEQPDALRRFFSNLISTEGVNLDGLHLSEEKIRKYNKIHIVACGTAYHSGLIGKYVIEELVRIPVEVDVASEFRYRNPLIDQDSLVIVVSQSGETADTLASLRLAQKRGAKVIALTNVTGSSISREADEVLYLQAGPEIAVASTKAYTTMLAAFYLLALHLASMKGSISKKEGKELIYDILRLPELSSEVIRRSEEQIKIIAKEYRDKKDIFFIGRNIDYTLAMEGALKLKEISYIHAEAYPAGELKHGTLALIEKGVPVIAVATRESILDKTISNIKEVKARSADVMAIVFDDNPEVVKAVDKHISIPRINQLFSGILAIIPLQLLAYYTAVERGCDVDQPRNLAKSVTVE